MFRLIEKPDTTFFKKSGQPAYNGGDSTKTESILRFDYPSFFSPPKTEDSVTKPPLKEGFPAFTLYPEDVQDLDDVYRVTGLSKDFINSIVKKEALRLKAYKDVGNHLTIGIGHNIDADPTYNLGKKITKAEAYFLFAKDLLKAKRDSEALTGGANLNQKQKEVVLDLLYNVHPDSLAASNVFGLMKEGKIDEAASKMTFVRSGGKFQTGLALRRLKNMSEFCYGFPSEKARESMNEILNNGSAVLDERIKKTKNPIAKRKLINEKKYFVKNAREIIKESTSNFFILRMQEKAKK